MNAADAPTEWTRAPLTGRISIEHGYAFKSEYFASSGPYAITKPGNFYEEGGFRDTGDKQQYYTGQFPLSYQLQHHDLIVVMTEQADGLLGSAAFVPAGTTYLHNQRIGRIRTNSDSVSLEYLFCVFNSPTYRKALNETAAGTKVRHTSPSKLMSVEVLFPPIDEQNLIASCLADADSLVETLERLIAKKHAIKQGMMQMLLTGKTRLPGFTARWRNIRLGEHVNYVKTVALSRAQLDDESPRRYLHYGDIHVSADIRLAAATADMPRAAAALLGSSGLLMVGDVVFADASEDPAGVGKSVEVTSVPAEGVVPGLHTIAARFNKKVLADGFKAYLQFIPEFRNSLLRLAAGTKVLATTRGYISSISLQLPDVDEQVEITRILREADDEIDTLRLRLVKARAVKQGMMQELLTGHTRLRQLADASV